MARYFETRRSPQAVDSTLAADVMRHLHARQYLGQAMIICADPDKMLQGVTRQWLKLSRSLQRQRLAATTAEEILRRTFSITHMQHFRLLAEPPQTASSPGAFVIRPDQLQPVPTSCLTAYLITELAPATLAALIQLLPPSALVVDYCDQLPPSHPGLLPKADLERQVETRWQELDRFLTAHRVNVPQMAFHPQAYSGAMNDALDSLLEVSIDFLRLASAFKRQLDIAQPLRAASKIERQYYDLGITLAHRIQALTPGGEPTEFLRSYTDETFFLRDHHHSPESWAELIAEHEQAGRWHLAQALRNLLRPAAAASFSLV